MRFGVRTGDSESLAAVATCPRNENAPPVRGVCPPATTPNPPEGGETHLVSQASASPVPPPPPPLYATDREATARSRSRPPFEEPPSRGPLPRTEAPPRKRRVRARRARPIDGSRIRAAADAEGGSSGRALAGAAPERTDDAGTKEGRQKKIVRRLRGTPPPTMSCGAHLPSVLRCHYGCRGTRPPF
jgi:hypothetical protein